MCSSLKKIQSALSLADHSLFHFKDLTSIITSYAISFVTKIINTIIAKRPHDLRIRNGLLWVIGEDRNRILRFTIEQGCLKPKDLEYKLKEPMFGFDSYDGEMIMVEGHSNNVHVHSGPSFSNETILEFDFEKVCGPMDIVINHKTRSFYIVDEQSLSVFDLKTKLKQNQHDHIQGNELCFNPKLQLLAVRYRNAVIRLFSVPSFEIKLEIVDHFVSFHTLTIAEELNSLIAVVYEWKSRNSFIHFYSLDNGDLLNTIQTSKFVSGMVYDSETGQLILSILNNDSLLLYE